jgi:DNA-binding FadR family transcriptional regulator
LTQSATPSQPTVEPGAYRPGYEIAAERILEYIVREQFAPGSRLPTEKDLAETLQLSRAVVREAVKILSAVGRLSVQKGRGIFVAAQDDDSVWRDHLARFLPADLRQVDELFEFRLLIESNGADLAAQRATPVQVKAIRQAALDSAEAAARGDVQAFTDADTEFHGQIGKASANMFLSAMVDSTRRLQQQTFTIGMAGAVGGSLVVAGEQHKAIAEAIGSGDPELARRLMTEHVDVTAQQFQTAVQRRIRDDTAR